MSHAFAAGGARQTAVLAAILGLHFAVFLVVAGSRIVVPPGSLPSLPITVLPKPDQPKPVLSQPDLPSNDDYQPDVVERPDIPIPVFPDDALRTDGTGILGGGEGTIVEVPVVQSPPALRTRPASMAAAINACYPAASRRMKEEGTVIALVTIGANGSAANWSVSQSSGFARLDAATACVLQKVDFVAGRRNGQAVAAEARLPIVFRLD